MRFEIWALGFICYLLFVICYLLFVICYLLFVICYLLFVICYLLFVICYSESGGTFIPFSFPINDLKSYSLPRTL